MLYCLIGITLVLRQNKRKSICVTLEQIYRCNDAPYVAHVCSSAKVFVICVKVYATALWLASEPYLYQSAQNSNATVRQAYFQVQIIAECLDLRTSPLAVQYDDLIASLCQPRGALQL